MLANVSFLPKPAIVSTTMSQGRGDFEKAHF